MRYRSAQHRNTARALVSTTHALLEDYTILSFKILRLLFFVLSTVLWIPAHAYLRSIVDRGVKISSLCRWEGSDDDRMACSGVWDPSSKPSTVGCCAKPMVLVRFDTSIKNVRLEPERWRNFNMSEYTGCSGGRFRDTISNSEIKSFFLLLSF